jgi:hypothetical protein
MVVASGSKRKRGDEDESEESEEGGPSACWNCRSRKLECKRTG